MSLTEKKLIQERDAALRDARTDYLTGLLNRRGLDHATRTDGKRGYYVAADLNGFKRAQDEHPCGHHYGDEVLEDFAAHLKAHTRQATDPAKPRPKDLVAARTGGDEFLVWCQSSTGARRIARKLAEWEYDGITASVGYGVDEEDADMMMYDDKLKYHDALENKIVKDCTKSQPLDLILVLALGILVGIGSYALSI